MSTVPLIVDKFQLFTRILREYIHKKTLRDQFIEEVLRKETNVTLKVDL